MASRRRSSSPDRPPPAAIQKHTTINLNKPIEFYSKSQPKYFELINDKAVLQRDTTITTFFVVSPQFLSSHDELLQLLHRQGGEGVLRHLLDASHDDGAHPELRQLIQDAEVEVEEVNVEKVEEVKAEEVKVEEAEAKEAKEDEVSTVNK